MNILIATEKPFAASAVEGIREIVEAAGHQLHLLERYTEKSELLTAVAEAEALMSLMLKFLMQQQSCKSSYAQAQASTVST